MKIKGSYKEIIAIGFPIILGSFAQSINQFIDMVFMGRVGIIEMGATNLGGMMYFLIVIIGMGFTKGGQIMIAKKTGEGNTTDVGNLFWHLFFIILVYFIVTLTASLFFANPLLSLLIKAPETLKYSIIYYQSRIIGLLFCLLAAGFNGFFSGIGKTKIIMISTIVMAISNIVLDYVLIFGHFGFPTMGIKGAGIATSIAEFLGLFVFIGYFIQKKLAINYKLFPIPTIAFIKLKEMMSLSLPLCFQYAFGLGSWFIFFLMIEKMGEKALAISSVLKSIYIFVGIPAWSLASTANTVIANIYGQKNTDLIIPALLKVVKLSVIVSLFFVAILVLFPFPILNFYMPNNNEFVRSSINSLYTIVIALSIMSVSTILLHGIMGLGKTRFSFFVEVFCAIAYLCFVYISVYSFNCPLYIVWCAEILYWLVMLGFSAYFLKFTNLKNL